MKPKMPHQLGYPPQEIDPCIAKVVVGEEIIVRMKKMESIVEEGKNPQRLFQDIGEFQKVVTVISASVMSKDSVKELKLQ